MSDDPVVSLIDTHTHLESFARRGELEPALERARAAGVGAMITIGTASDDWSSYREIAAAHPGRVHCTAGLHPCSVDERWEREVAALPAFWTRGGGSRRGADVVPPGKGHVPEGDPPPSDADVAPGAEPDPERSPEAPRPVALGECGLDRYHLPQNDPAAADRIFGWQRDAFVAQLALARTLACPVVVHSRGAFAECVAMIDASGVDWTRVVFHCFAEGEAEMRELQDRGGYGSFTGILTYKSAEAVRAAARAQGLERLMLETDAPYLTPMPHRGKPNEPAFLRHTAEFAAGLFGVSEADLAAITTATARRFFGI